MTGYLKIAGSAVLYGMIAAASPVQAVEPDRNVKEGQAVVTTLGGDTSAVTYWVSQADGWHVVTTVDTKNTAAGSDDHAVVRFSAVLQPGQSHSISIPAAVGEKQPALLIRRVADRIEVETDPALLN